MFRKQKTIKKKILTALTIFLKVFREMERQTFIEKWED